MVALTVLALPFLPTSAATAPDGSEGAGLELVSEVSYLSGTHIEHATIAGRDYVFAATQSVAGPAQLRVIDVTRPSRPKVVATLPCGRFQGNLQVSADRRTLVLGVDGPAQDGRCVRTASEGFATIDISRPERPRPVGFASIDGGSHSTAAHPTEPLIYNAPEGSPVPDRPAPVLEVWSIHDPRKPTPVSSTSLPGVHSPHDISFNSDGSMAAVASISAFHLVDTSDPEHPRVVFTGQCPGCQHTHEARFTPDANTLVVNDEAMTGAAYPCPGGALYFYDVSDVTAPQLVGTYMVGDLAVTSASSAGFCTPHVFDISADGKQLATSWHAAGIRLLDITGHSGHTVGTTWSTGPDAVREVGSYTTASGDYFTAKLHRGPYVYAVDMNRGLQIFKTAS